MDPNPNDDFQRFARAIFHAQPFSMFLGAELVEAGVDSAQISLRLRPELTQQHGFAHGGVISYLADNALTFAGGLALGGDALTVEYKINYARPATGEALLVATAHAVTSTRRQATCQCSIHARDQNGERLIALAQGTIVRA